MHRTSTLALVLAAALAACSSSEDAGEAPIAAPGCTEGEPGCIGFRACPPELAPDPEGAGCREIVPDEACAPGTMAVLGSTQCEPVGPAACPEGFTKAASGWGCAPVIPEAACAGATRSALGSSACVPVGDCDAPFPPAGATHFVSAAYTDAQVDATHFKTIADALAAAPSGAVVAVDTGTYAEGIDAKRAVTVVGRCAERVRLVGTGKEVWGVLANGVKNVTVRGVTLEDHYEGARAQRGGTITLEDTVIEAPRSVGLIAWQPGSAIHAERVVVRNVKPHPSQSVAVMSVNADVGGLVELVDSELAGSWEAGAVATNFDDAEHTSTLHLERTVIRDTNLDEHSGAGAGLVIAYHSHAEVTDSAIVNTRRIGVVAIGAATGSVKGSVIQTTLEDSSGESAAGVFAIEGAHVDLTDTTVRDAAQTGLFAIDGGSTVTMTNGVIEASRPGADGDFGIGAWADQGGALALTNTAVVDNAYYGVGLNAPGTTATLSRVLIQGTKTTEQGTLGRGLNVEYGASATLDRVTLRENHDVSLFVRGETEDGARAEVTATRVLVLDPETQPDGTLGTGVAVERGAKLTLDTAAILRAKDSGVRLNELLGDAGSVSEASLTHTIVRGTMGVTKVDANMSALLAGAGVVSGGLLTLESSAVVDNLRFGVLVADPTSAATIQSCFVGGTKPGPETGDYGHGIVAIGSPSLVVRSSVVRDNAVGIAFKGSPGIVSDVLIEHNAVGIHVEGDGLSLTTAESAPEAPSPDAVVVTDDSRFVDNTTRVGSGVVPLPEDPFGASADSESGAPKGGF